MSDDVLAEILEGIVPEVGARPASSFAVRRVEWLTDDQWWPIGFLSVLGGKGGLGKSTETAALAAKVTTGTAGGHYGTEPRDVFMLSAEDTIAEVLNPRLIAAGADLDRVQYLVIGDDPFALSIPADLPAFEQLIAGHPAPVGLVVLDPLVAFIGDGVDTHRDHDTRRALRPLADTAARLAVPVVGVMHVNKAKGGDAYGRLMASAAFYNAVRFVAVFGGDPQTPDGETRVIVADKSNLGPSGMSRLLKIETVEIGDGIETVRSVDLGASTVTAAELLGEHAAATAPKTETALELIEEAWMQAGGAVDASHIRTRLDDHNRNQPADEKVSWSTAKGALRKLGGRSRKKGTFGGDDAGWEWVPPDGYFDDPKGWSP